MRTNIHESDTSIVRSKDGRFFRIPDEVLKSYAVPSDKQNGTSAGQWIYETPTVCQAMDWGDDIDPTGGMSSAARRG